MTVTSATIMSPAMTDRRVPLHLAVLLGTSTAAYAVSLAGVAAFQSQADRAAIERQDPSVAAADRLVAGHDQLQSDLDLTAQAFEAAAARYDAIAADLSSLDAALADHAARMAKVSGAARALPQHVSLPSVTRVVTRTVSKPRVSASTGASGG
jgi:hypothetical protein